MALHRHQSSLEKILDFSQPFSLTPQQLQAATTLFRYLIQHYGLEQTIQPGVANPIDSDITVVLSFFNGFSSWDQNQKQNANGAIESFAEYIVENFLLPHNLVRASSVKTPQPTPRSLSSIQASTPTGTTQCVSILRQSCLVLDHHRCVVSRKFDKSEASKRWKQNGEDCKDDDGNPLKNESSDRFQYLEGCSHFATLSNYNLEEIDDVRADGSTNLGISPTAKTPKKDTFHVQEVNGPLQGRVTWRSRPIHRT
ncbi:hypothetical protein I7I51_05823 [Histoplasma capsulatum]|uniref:Uncharacterized protein n=1 Tax=Ajellomyces capsulatus TaxID=5037 RepID=A0A8A1M3D0_AJECA|nr:hypothetical protein I7I51_05823 [Histoplasma capsulatum]